MVPDHSKRIVIQSKEIFKYEEFKFLFKDFEKRWILDISRLILEAATNIRPPPQKGKNKNNNNNEKGKGKSKDMDANYNALTGKKTASAKQASKDEKVPVSAETLPEDGMEGNPSGTEKDDDNDDGHGDSHETAAETATSVAPPTTSTTTSSIVWYSKQYGNVLEPSFALVEPKQNAQPGKISDRKVPGEQIRLVWKRKAKKTLPLDRIAKKVTGGSYCARGRYCYWQKDASLRSPLQHLGIRCRLLLEFLIAISPHRSIKYKFWTLIAQQMMEEWKVKFKDNWERVELEKKAGDHMGEEATDPKGGESGEVDAG